MPIPSPPCRQRLSDAQAPYRTYRSTALYRGRYRTRGKIIGHRAYRHQEPRDYRTDCIIGPKLQRVRGTPDYVSGISARKARADLELRSAPTPRHTQPTHTQVMGRELGPITRAMLGLRPIRPRRTTQRENPRRWSPLLARQYSRHLNVKLVYAPQELYPPATQPTERSQGNYPLYPFLRRVLIAAGRQRAIQVFRWPSRACKTCW